MQKATVSRERRTSTAARHTPANAPARASIPNRVAVREALAHPSVQTSLTIGRSDDAHEQEADRVADQVMRMPAGENLQREPAEPESPEPTEAEPPAACIPDTSLTWAQFKGTAPSGGDKAAFTSTAVNEVSYEGQKLFQAEFEESSSWVKEQYAKPSELDKNGCRGDVTACEKFFDENPGGSGWGPGTTTGCDAAIGPDPKKVANTKEECTSIVGTECTRAAELESERILRHEQLHFDIVCVLVGKGNAALAAGKSFAKVSAALTTQVTEQSADYDTETSNGCKPTEQAAWETKVFGGFPKVTLP